MSGGDDELELRCRIDGLELALGVFLNSPLNRDQFRVRFADLEDIARKNNMHAATIEVLKRVRERLSGEQ